MEIGALAVLILRRGGPPNEPALKTRGLLSGGSRAVPLKSDKRPGEAKTLCSDSAPDAFFLRFASGSLDGRQAITFQGDRR